MILIVRLGPENEEKTSVNSALYIGKSNCETYSLKSYKLLSHVNHMFLEREIGM